MNRRFVISASLFCAAALLPTFAADDPKPGEKEVMKDKEAMKDKMMKAGGATGKSLPKLEAEATGSEVIYFSAEGPIKIRFTATIDGKPVEDLWRESVDSLFKFCDKNSDGQLDAKERATFTNRGPQYVLSDAEGNVYSPSAAQLTFADKSAKLDRDAFRAAFRSAGLAPVQIAVKAGRSKTAEMTESLFKLLDANKDGKLSVEELKAVRDRLSALDVNQDELVSSQELTGRGYGNPSNGFFYQQMLNSNNKPVEQTDFVFPSVDPVAAAKELLKLRDKNKDGSLSREELGYPNTPGPIALDKDANGKVTEAELAAWLRGGPDLHFRLDFGEALHKKTWVNLAVEALTSMSRPPGVAPSGLTLVTSTDAGNALAAKIKKESNGDVTLVLNDARLRFSANRDMKQQLLANWTGQMENIKTQFDTQAGDGKVIDKKKFQEDPNLNGMIGLFDFADKNSDGKIDKKEVVDALGALTPLIGCRADVSINDQGRGLFELLDRDGDGRLSPREMATAHTLIATLDRNGDSLLDKDEVPKVIAAAASLASAQVIQASGYFGDFNIVSQAAVPRIVTAGGAPEWFLKMDRNGDNDISAREFLGPAELFKKLDKDGDGLLSPEEARAIEK